MAPFSTPYKQHMVRVAHIFDDSVSLHVLNVLVGNDHLLLPFFVAGSCSGLANSFITGPIELAKCIQQQSSIGVCPSANSRPPSTISILRETFRHWGISGPCRGLFTTMLRDTPSFGMYFLAYEAIMLYGSSNGSSNVSRNHDLYTEFERYVEQYGTHSNSPLIKCVPPLKQKEQSGEFVFPPLLLTLFAGATSGVLSWIVTYPLDVIKTRIQSTPLHLKANGIIQTCRTMVGQAGVVSLFRGLNVTLLRAIPTNAITFLGFSLTISALSPKM